QFKIIKIKGNIVETTEATLVDEIPLTIIINGTELATFLCTPQDTEELILGFLFTSGLIKKVEEIKKIGVDRNRWTAYIELTHESVLQDMISKRVYTSGCGRGIYYYNAYDLMLKNRKILSEYKINSGNIFVLMEALQKESQQFKATGGVHSAALANNTELLVFMEDIGRHNAIDKVIGYSLKKKISFKDKIILTTGRISSEVLFKIQKIEIPIIISRSAPSNHAIRLAEEMNITVVGFVRGKTMNIYSIPERIEI
ncbi:MAG: formate dehydrogenase accessory sulfurtransferase FdhD, partial [Candidatus Aminicenantes bacterium]|nr:formate dehydrogenase accessory sulfurtransferase FdhD [Candidatus Aminicenantes bacterium]